MTIADVLCKAHPVWPRFATEPAVTGGCLGTRLRDGSQGFFQGGAGGAFAPLGSLSPPLGTGRFVNDNSSLMYG